MISFKPLLKTLVDKNMRLTDLFEILPRSITVKIKKNGNVTTSTLNKICSFLDCNLSDVVEYVKDDGPAER